MESDQRLLDGIGIDDPIATRAVYCFLKSGHLGSLSNNFLEDAILNLHLSMEWTLELICRRIIASSNDKPRPSDALEYIRDQMEMGEHVLSFIREMNELWVSAKHPRNRFYNGVWAPPYIADDYYETYDLVGQLLKMTLCKRS